VRARSVRAKRWDAVATGVAARGAVGGGGGHAHGRTTRVPRGGGGVSLVGLHSDAREGNLTPTDAKARQRDPTATRSGRPCSFPSLPVHFSRDPADNGICRRAGPRSRLHLCPRHLAMVISDRAACLVSAFHELSSDPGGDDPMPRHMDRLET